MKVPYEKSIAIMNLFNNKKDYFHYESAIKILDILEIKYEANWINNVLFVVEIPESSTFNKNKIIKFLQLAKDVCSSCANKEYVDEGEAIDSIMVLEDVIKIIKN